MPTIIQAEPEVQPQELPVLAAVTDIEQSYLKARQQADALAQEHNLTVPTMPQLIHALYVNHAVRAAVRPSWSNVVSAEYHGTRDQKPVYEVWHGVGSLATAEGTEKAIPRVGDYGFIPLVGREWSDAAKKHPRIHIDDLKKDQFPDEAHYIVFMRIEQDDLALVPPGQLDYDTWMQDDRVLAVTGNLEAREQLAQLLFGNKEYGGEGLPTVGSYHRLNDVGFDDAVGRPVFLGSNCDGLFGVSNISINYSRGRFAGVGAPEVLASARGAPREAKIVRPTLDQVLALATTHISSAGQKAFEHDVRALYN